MRVLGGGPPGGDVHLLEEAEALQRLAALAQLASPEKRSCSWSRISRRMTLSRVLVLPVISMLVDRDRRAALDLEGDVDDLRLRVDVGLAARSLTKA